MGLVPCRIFLLLFLHCPWLVPRGNLLLLLFTCMYLTLCGILLLLFTHYMCLEHCKILLYPIKHCMMLTPCSLKNPSIDWYIAQSYLYCFYVACFSQFEESCFCCFYITFDFTLRSNFFAFIKLNVALALQNYVFAVSLTLHVACTYQNFSFADFTLLVAHTL